MKKLIPVILIVTIVLTLFSGCKKSEEVKQCENLIKEIGEVTLDSLEAIEKAEKAYGMLTGEDKGKVKNFDDLTEARKIYNEIKAFSDSINEFNLLTDRIFRDYAVNAESINTAFGKLKESLDNVSVKAKPQCEAMFAGAEEKFNAYTKKCEEAVPSAAAYVKAFFASPEAKNKTITIEKIGCVAQLDDDTIYYIFALSYTENGVTKNVYSTARFAGTPSTNSILAHSDSFFAAKPLSDSLNGLENFNIAFDTEKVLTAVSD